MASFWRRLFGGDSTDPSDPHGDLSDAPETVRRIVAELDALTPHQARFLAAFAYVLSRVAYADLDVSLEETGTMEAVVEKVSGIDSNQAALVVEIASSQARLAGGTENFLVTREFARIASEEDKKALVDCLFAVSAADDLITGVEESQIRQIASELGLTHGDYVAARAAWSEKRAVLRDL